jgi:hypothetical protein
MSSLLIESIAAVVGDDGHEKKTMNWPAPYVYGDFAREIQRWALFMGGTWPLKQGRGPVAIKTRHAKANSRQKSIMS